MNLTPTYAWFDGTSKVIVRGQVPAMNADGQYELALPNGTVKSAGAKIHPMKEHLSNSARHAATGQLVPHATSVYSLTGDLDQAVAAGMAWAGMAGEWTLVDVHTWQSLNHGVEPSDNALDCGQCHASYATTPTRMDLPAMGYTLKGPASTICSQCHSYKSSKGFATNHSKHVTEKRRDCMWCHDFSRPERNLIRPPIPGDINGDGYVDVVDLLYLVDAFGSVTGDTNYDPDADFNNDGSVDVVDLLILVENFGL
jgi:hypothetical protein